MKTFYILVSLVSLCLVNGIIASINVQSVPNLCDQDAQETINMGGIVHYEVTSVVSDRSDNLVEETQRVLYDMYAQSFMELDLTSVILNIQY